MNPQAVEARGLRQNPGLRGLWQKACRVGPLLSRIVAAILGGYALAALTSVAMLALTDNAVQGVIAGQTASFLVYACAVIWVFAVRSAVRAWGGLLVAAVPLALAAWWVTKGVLAA